jgi:hypothetical protein
MPDRLSGPSMLALIDEINGPNLSAPRDPGYRRLPNPERCSHIALTCTTAQKRERPRLRICGYAPASMLGHHVGAVVRLRSQEEMIGPAARRIVTPMADAHPRWNRPVHQRVGDSVRVSPALPIPHATVPLFVAAGTSPRPATVRATAINAGPESSSKVSVRASIAAGSGAIPLRWVARLAGVGSAQKTGATPFTGQCDTLRGHQADSLVSDPGACRRAGSLRVEILP